MKSRKLYTGCFDAVLCLSTITICTSHDIKEISKNYPRQFYISCLERVHCLSGVSLCTTHNCSVGLPLTSLISQIYCMHYYKPNLSFKSEQHCSSNCTTDIHMCVWLLRGLEAYRPRLLMSAPYLSIYDGIILSLHSTLLDNRYYLGYELDLLYTSCSICPRLWMGAETSQSHQYRLEAKQVGESVNHARCCDASAPTRTPSASCLVLAVRTHQYICAMDEHTNISTAVWCPLYIQFICPSRALTAPLPCRLPGQFQS